MKNTRHILLVFSALLLAGCATTQAKLMPSETIITTSQWQSYEEARKTYDSIEPYKTTLADLKNMIDPEGTVSKIEYLPNVKYMDATALQNVFMKPGTSGGQKIPKEVERCLSESFEKCHSYEFPLKRVVDRGVGNIFKRWLNFRKENIARGPDVIFQVFLNGDVVIFKRWEGTPNVNLPRLKVNPLGPLQEPFELILKYTPTP